MKIRQCYVSNSSSSSYIISYNPQAKTILTSEDGIKIEYKVSDFIRQLESKYQIHSQSTMIERRGSDTIYEYAKSWYSDEELKSLKEFLDKNPEEHKLQFQINYDDNFLKRTLLNLYKLKLIDILADEYALRDDC